MTTIQVISALNKENLNMVDSLAIWVTTTFNWSLITIVRTVFLTNSNSIDPYAREEEQTLKFWIESRACINNEVTEAQTGYLKLKKTKKTSHPGSNMKVENQQIAEKLTVHKMIYRMAQGIRVTSAEVAFYQRILSILMMTWSEAKVISPLTQN